MRAGPLSLLVLLLCLSCAQADVAVQPGFDVEKFSGTWHVVAAVSNCSTFQSMRGVMKTSVAKVTALPDGDMSILTGFPVSEECRTVKMHFKKTEQPGHFTSDEKGARQDLRVLATDYASFAFVYVCKEAAGERSLTVQLYARHPGVVEAVMGDFREHFRRVGLTDDLMAVLPRSDVCLQHLSG
ncbi:lipocalin-15 [Varanus komodoensis]|uniref:lipocalin-15 n=1 Tax=Varanus komodoensis TaxID=61221 RepID=UPI001CF7D4D6|nr:lipocalin-15 [Varanus komodoensis]